MWVTAARIRRIHCRLSESGQLRFLQGFVSFRAVLWPSYGHVAIAVIAADGNVLGTPATVPLGLTGLSAAIRDGRLRAAISALIATAKAHGARAIVIEDLDFTQARAEGRERASNRPSRGRRGKDFRRAIFSIPTGRFRDRVVQMAANAGLSVIVVDPPTPPAGGPNTGSSRCGSTTRRRPVTTRQRW